MGGAVWFGGRPSFEEPPPIAFRLFGCYYGDMRWRDLFPLAANLLPLDKVFVRPRDRVKSLQKLKATLEGYETPNDLAEASPGNPEPLSPATVETSPESAPGGLSEAIVAIPSSPQKTQELSVPPSFASEEDIKNYQVGIILGKIDTINEHLAYKCRIPPGQLSCDCCPNHLWGLRDRCIETVKIIPEKERELREIADWVTELALRSPDNLTLPLSDEEFTQKQTELRRLRKRFTGAAKPELAQKFEEELGEHFEEV